MKTRMHFRWLITLAIGVSVAPCGAWPSRPVPDTAHRRPWLVGTWVDAATHPDGSRLFLRADHTFRMYKGRAYRRLTATGFVSIPHTARGTWNCERRDSRTRVVELTLSASEGGTFLISAAGRLVAAHESGVKGLPDEMRRLLPAHRD